ncbi:Uncharacterized protein GBIM_03539, partial [Gryllus bimaculatus]
MVELEAVPEKNEKLIEELRRHEENLNKEKVKAEVERDKVVASIQQETQVLQDQKEALETKLLSRQKVTSELKDRFDVAQSALDIYLSTEQNEKSKLETMQANLENSTRTLQEREEYLKKLQKEIPELTKQFQEAQTELQKVQVEEAKQSDALRQVRSKVEENRISMQATRSQGRVLDFIMNQKQSGAIEGIMGRLGDLGAIDAKYDVAVSTACGPLDNIVVDTVETAQACIRALKDHDVGRATFIALEKQEYLRPQTESRINTPENVPRLFDLIKVQDNSVKTAFYYGLRDTLVANDLTQATRIAYGSRRYRVVTLEGQLIETSGTMSGGGRTKLQGRMGNKIAGPSVSPQEQEKMERDCENLEAVVIKLRQRQSTLEEQVQQINSSLPQMQMRLKKGSMEIQLLKNQLPVLKDQLKQQQQKLEKAKPDPKETKKLEETRDAAQKEYSEAEEEKKTVEREVKKIHNKIMEKTKGRVAACQKVVDDINAKLGKTRKECTSLSVAIKTATRNHKICQDKIKNLEIEIEESVKKLMDLKEQKETFEQEGNKLLTEMDDLADVIVQKETEKLELKEKQPDISGNKTNLRSKKLEKEQKLEACLKQINDHQNSIINYKKKIKELKIHEVPGKPLVELKTYTLEEITAVEMDRLQYEVSVKEQNLSEKAPNLAVLAEYKEKTDLFIQRTNELEDVTLHRNKARQFLEEVRQQRLSEFLDGYSIITHKLKEMYQMLTLGGDAELELVDSLDPFSEGIDRTKNAQFIIISLRSNMFELADHLIGIFKTWDCTKSVTINPKAYGKNSRPVTSQLLYFVIKYVYYRIRYGRKNRLVEL